MNVFDIKICFASAVDNPKRSMWWYGNHRAVQMVHTTKFSWICEFMFNPPKLICQSSRAEQLIDLIDNHDYWEIIDVMTICDVYYWHG